MKKRLRSRGRIIPILVGCFAAGMVTGWVARGSDTSAVHFAASAILPAERSTASTEGAENNGPSDAVRELRRHGLRLPIEGARVAAMRGQFGDTRSGGTRGHEAVDILAPRGTPVHAVEAGAIAKLFLSKAGGITVYQFDPTGRFCYYYAHLERYANNLREGSNVAAGDVIGYVGTTGNAPPDTPHLHFAVFELTPARHWWEGRPIDPYLLFET